MFLDEGTMPEETTAPEVSEETPAMETETPAEETPATEAGESTEEVA